MRRGGFRALICAALLLSGGAALAAEGFDWQLPRGFPRPPVPRDNPMSTAKVALGKKLFTDTRLSVTGRHSCASCHQPELAFTDGKKVAVGAMGDLLRRSAMPLANVAWNTSFNWADNRPHNLEEQMRTPLFGEHPVELGMREDDARLLAMLGADPDYARAFEAAFPAQADAISVPNLLRAIASFERTLISGRSAFDRYVFDDDRTALSEAARRGMTLFFSTRTDCSRCHSGINFSGAPAVAGQPVPEAVFVNTGLYNVDGRGGYPAADRGLMEVTGRAADNGRFRVPSLRNVQLTAPYMHDGSIATLEEVIDHYDRGGRQLFAGARRSQNLLKDPLVRKLSLSRRDKSDLRAFLESLTDPAFVSSSTLRSK